VQIVSATESDAPAIGELIAASFGKLDASRWLVNDQDDWEKIAPRYFEGQVRDAIANGVVHTVPDLSAAVVVFDYTVEPESTPEREIWLKEITGPYFDRFVRFEASLAAGHPSKPHQYGALVAVRSTGRNEGVGSRLLDHHHRVLDERGQNGYGEASSKRLEIFFARHGYTPLGPPITLDGQELLQPMWREARRTG
jgi:hypothetical protein